MARMGTLNGVFEGNIERRTPSISLMNKFDRRALNSHRLTRHVANFVKLHIEKPRTNGTYPQETKLYRCQSLAVYSHNHCHCNRFVTTLNARHLAGPHKSL